MGIPCVVSEYIHDNVIVNSNVISLSLEDPVAKWADAVLSPMSIMVSDKIGQYDIKCSVKKLEKIYLYEEN